MFYVFFLFLQTLYILCLMPDEEREKLAGGIIIKIGKDLFFEYSSGLLRFS